MLGPLLLLLFIADIRVHLKFAEGMIFAYDTQIYLFAQLNEGLSKIAHDVSVISDYATKNGLNLNVGKSKILILGSIAYVNGINYYDLPCISVNGINLPYVSEERNLGVWMMSNP